MQESPENNLFDLPDYEHEEDERFPPFPPPSSPGRSDNEGAESSQGRKKEKTSPMDDPPVNIRKRVKRNLPKLDAQRLISERGLPALRQMFDNVKFKGKGHEAEDLKTLIRHMEHWAHRLFPKLQFEDFIDRLERLGNKKEVQTCLKRIRLDLPIVHEDFISKDGDDEGESREKDGSAPDIDPFFTNSAENAEFASPSSTDLTEEQQQRIERNRRLALERRQAKLLTNSQPQENDTSVTGPTTEVAEEADEDEGVPSEIREGILDTRCNTADLENTEDGEQLGGPGL
ncbi:TIMELESS-interacting protein [Tachyglossus aculeatus]|uniref:TIMELESS-interacting protein n=1 Tax=Tachyglossus aculeatus TaxID=9261 RepID=UPI0018F56CC4|nr:TIMELESS-interacting protein [Tachyglossus aculeatus]XP_038623531.1 TIMELESS-interacting protein [Tachyglossus aculeatus]XP_038623533.1 TIMELESS-interacting protein [Tachyglossus aculeatus]